jgi:hypothetical protein
MSLAPQETRSIDALGLSAAAGLALAVAGLGLWPMLDRLGEIDRARAELAQVQAQNDEQALAVRSSAAGLERARARLANESIVLRPAGELNTHVRRLTELAAAQGLKLDQINPGAPQRGPRYTSVPLKLGGTGTYGQVERFLRALRSEHPDTAVIAFQITQPLAEPVPAGASKSEKLAQGASVASAQFMLDMAWFAAGDDQSNPTRMTAVPTP